VIAADQAPDHATVARFRVRHETAIAELFGGVLELCGIGRRPPDALLRATATGGWSSAAAG
jgi:hypothetical protein